MSKDQEQTAHETKNINIIYNTYKKKYILNFKVGIKTEVDIFAVRYLLCSNQNFGEIFIRTKHWQRTPDISEEECIRRYPPMEGISEPMDTICR